MTPILKSWAVAKFKALLVLYTIIACFSAFDRGAYLFIFSNLKFNFHPVASNFVQKYSHVYNKVLFYQIEP